MLINCKMRVIDYSLNYSLVTVYRRKAERNKKTDELTYVFFLK